MCSCVLLKNSWIFLVHNAVSSLAGCFLLVCMSVLGTCRLYYEYMCACVLKISCILSTQFSVLSTCHLYELEMSNNLKI